MDKKKNLIYIDVLKGFAMLGVVMVHFTQNFGSGIGAVNGIGYAGARCPQLFLIISAYLTWGSLSRRGGVGKEELLSFYKGRIVKLAPLFYLALVVSTLLPVIRWQEWSVGSLLTHLTFTNGLFPEWTNDWMHMEWYIAVLALFYILTPILYKCSHSLKSSMLTLLGVTALNIVFTLVTNRVFADKITSNENYEMYFHTFCIINQLPVLMMGVVLYYGIDWMQKNQVSMKKVLGAFLCVVMVVLAAFVGLHLNKTVMTSSFIAGMMFSGLFLVMSSVNGKLNGGGISWYSGIINVLAKIGKHSYGIYCLHYTIILCLMQIPYVQDVNGKLWAWVILYAAVIVVSYYLGIFAEKITTNERKNSMG